MNNNQNQLIDPNINIEILRDLSISEYQFIKDILDNDQKRGYTRIFNKMQEF